MKFLKILVIIIFTVLIIFNFFFTERPSFLYEADKNVDRSYSESLKNVESELDIEQNQLPKLEIVNDPSKPSILGDQSDGQNTTEDQVENVEPEEDQDPIEFKPSEDFDFRGGRGDFDENGGAYKF